LPGQSYRQDESWQTGPRPDINDAPSSAEAIQGENRERIQEMARLDLAWLLYGRYIEARTKDDVPESLQPRYG
jgi:hypothetical protein